MTLWMQFFRMLEDIIRAAVCLTSAAANQKAKRKTCKIKTEKRSGRIS